MAGEKDDSLDDPSLLNDEEIADEVEVQQDADPGEGKDPKDKKAPGADDDVEVVIEEETEEELEARRRREEEAPLEQEGRVTEHEDDPDAKYSKEVRARIERERRIAREANARAQTAHRARLEAEAKSRAARKEAVEVTEVALETSIKNTRAALLKAKEDGKSEDEVRLQEEFDRLNRRKDSLADAKRGLEQEEEAAKHGGGEGPNDLARQWMERNEWFSDARFGEQIMITRAIDRALAAKGFDKNTQGYYDELDRRIRRRLPELQRYMQRRPGQRLEVRPDAGKEKRREPTGGVRRAEGRDGEQTPRKGKIVLKRSDLDNMRAFGLDPNNKEHLREYALNKR